MINTMRLEKYMAISGIASRRAVKKRILAGAVSVNGEPVLVPGHPIDIETDVVECEGKRVEPLKERLYLMLNKPAGCISQRAATNAAVRPLWTLFGSSQIPSIPSDV